MFFMTSKRCFDVGEIVFSYFDQGRVIKMHDFPLGACVSLFIGSMCYMYRHLKIG
jgi:hypothetical protein